MSLNKPWSTLCLLSLSVPALGIGSPFWFFSSAPGTTCSKSSEQKEMSETKCDAVKPCCETKTITEVVRVCEDPCHPKHNSWEAALSLGIGYRHDRLNQKFSPSASSGAASLRTKYRDIDSVMGVLRFDGRLKNFVFGFEGDYSPTVDGQIDQKFNGTPVQSQHFRFKKISGYEADAQIDIGYRLEFINGKHGRAYIVPVIGYNYSHQAYETDSQDDYRNPAFAGNVIQYMQDQSPMHSEWFGPFVEAKLSFIFWDHFTVDPFYQYYFLDYRARTKFSQTGITIDPDVVGAPATQQTITKALIHNDSARGQSAGIDLHWQFDNQFRLGAKGAWYSFETQDARAHVKSSQKVFSTNPPVTTVTHLKEDAHASWTSYSFYLYGGYAF